VVQKLGRDGVRQRRRRGMAYTVAHMFFKSI